MELQENLLKEELENKLEDNPNYPSWIDKLTRKQKRLIFKKDKFTNRVKKLLK